MSTQINSSLNNTNNNSNFFGQSYLNEKEKSNKGSSILTNIKENNDKIIEKGKLYDDLKNTNIELFYNIATTKFEYKKIKIGEKLYNDIKDIDNDEIPKDEKVEGFIKFFEEINEKVDDEYNKTNNFELELIITGDKNSNSCKLDCLYKLTIDKNHNGEKKVTSYRDFDILIKGATKGLKALLRDLNSD